jgi:hypothetical protein
MDRRLLVGRPEEWDAFVERHRAFYDEWPALRGALDTVTNGSFHIKSKTDLVIYFLVHLCIEDFLEIQLLAANGHGVGAKKLVRGLYERVVTARYLSKNPDEVEAFIDWDSVTNAKVARAAVDTLSDHLPPDDIDRLKAVIEEAAPLKKRFEVTVCKECGAKGLNHTWSKLDFVSMTRSVGGSTLGFIVPAYYDPLRYAHSTLKALDARIREVGPDGLTFDHGPQRPDADTALILGHNLLLNIVDLAVSHFGLKGPAEEALGVACKAFERIWGNKDEVEKKLH